MILYKLPRQSQLIDVTEARISVYQYKRVDLLRAIILFKETKLI